MGGKQKGIAKIRKKMIFLIIVGVVCLFCAGFGVALTIRLLHDVNHAFIPALFCLCIGTSAVFIGFHVLKLRAALKLELYINGHRELVNGDGLNEENIDLDDLLKRVLYPKIKGQRGGGFVWSDVERTQIDVLAGTIKPKRSKPMKKLKQFTKLFNLKKQRRTRSNRQKSKFKKVA